MPTSGVFSELFVTHWRNLQRHVSAQAEGIELDGQSLQLADVIASARYSLPASVRNDVLERVSERTEKVYGKIQDGEIVYGINTGFGASANVRTQAIEEIQRGLIRGLHYGVLSGATEFDITDAASGFAKAIPLQDPIESTSMPESWVRAAILIRLNSLSHGASGVRPMVLERLCQLLNLDVVPRVPLRGSVSASGDLSPLSYVGGVLQGKPSVQAWVGARGQFDRRLVSAKEALEKYDIKPIDVRAKEGLALVNGTATSAAVASLAVHEALSLAGLSQVLTAMSVEALRGTDESFHEFFSECRPHPGQIECARNIQAFLSGSQLILDNTGSGEFAIRQDRYSIRTAPQWVGPVLEDLVLAHSQVSIEINSATDNPLVHESGKMLHGGNFQAKAVTSAMEKVRQSCQSLGQMLFAQCTEIINPATNKGLAPNLVVDEPSQSWMWKGTDIYMAALQSELGFLSNPVGTHVQFAEMGNQGINSLALISARYTLTSVDVLTQLTAAHLVALCQALDLRALDIKFSASLESQFVSRTLQILNDAKDDITPKLEAENEQTAQTFWTAFSESIHRNTHMDSTVRFGHAIDSLQTRLLRHLPSTQQTLDKVQKWNKDCASIACDTYREVKESYLKNPDAKPVLGSAAKVLYSFVREKLEVPFFGEEYIKAADWADDDLTCDGEDDQTSTSRKYKYKTMGSMISAVYEAMRNGSLHANMVDCFDVANAQYT